MPPLIPTCAGADSVSDELVNRGLVYDCTILLDSMDALAGTATLDWDKDTAVADWEGISLNSSSTRVARLVLDDEDLDGSIPPPLGDLSDLASLDLSGNDLSAPIPGELRLLSELATLSLNGNRFTGPIPVELSELSELTSLDLSDNDLTGTIPVELVDITNLGFLRLAGNNFDGCVPMGSRNVADSDLDRTGIPFCDVFPEGPVALSAIGESRAMDLTWTAPEHSGWKILKYQYHLLGGDGTWTDIPDSHEYGVNATSYRIADLRVATAYSVAIRALNGAGFGEQSAIASAITNTPPTIDDVQTAERWVEENAPTGQPLNEPVTVTDPDTRDTLIYSLSGSDAALFDIDALTGQDRAGQITVGSGTMLDYETRSSYTVTVNVSDGREGADSLGLTITIIDVNEAPAAVGRIRVAAMTEGDRSRRVVLADSFVDPDGDDLRYSAMSSRRSVVRVSVSGDTLELDPGGSGTARITVTASDPDGLQASLIFTVRVREDESSGSAVQPTAPGPPGILDVERADGIVTLKWTAAPDNGSPIYGYQVQTNGGAWADVAGGQAARSMTLSVPADHLEYVFWVRAVNSLGVGGAMSVTAAPMSVQVSTPTETPMPAAETPVPAEPTAIATAAALPTITPVPEPVTPGSATTVSTVTAVAPIDAPMPPPVPTATAAAPTNTPTLAPTPMVVATNTATPVPVPIVTVVVTAVPTSPPAPTAMAMVAVVSTPSAPIASAAGPTAQAAAPAELPLATASPAPATVGATTATTPTAVAESGQGEEAQPRAPVLPVGIGILALLISGSIGVPVYVRWRRCRLTDR